MVQRLNYVSYSVVWAQFTDLIVKVHRILRYFKNSPGYFCHFKILFFLPILVLVFPRLQWDWLIISSIILFIKEDVATKVWLWVMLRTHGKLTAILNAPQKNQFFCHSNGVCWSSWFLLLYSRLSPESPVASVIVVLISIATAKVIIPVI